MEKIKYFIFITIITIAYTYTDISMFIQIAFDVKNKFSLHNSLIIMNVNDYNNDNILLVQMKELSKIYKLSIILNYDKFSQAIDYYYDILKPFLIVFIKSFEDFKLFINATKNYKLNAFWSFLIFTNDDSILNICLHPKKNYFNLVYNTRMFILCYKDNSTTISEWYSLNPSKTKVIKLATWNETKGLIFTNSKPIFERRKSLKGITLRISDLRKYSTDKLSNESVGGLFQDVLELIESKTNFTAEYQQLEDAYGVYNDTTKEWGGLLGRLIRNETDIALAEIAETKERSDLVDFSVPIIPSYLNYYLKKQINSWYLPWSAYYEPFSLNAARSLIFILIIAPLLIGFIKFIKKKLYNKIKINSGLYKMIEDCFFDIWAIFCRMQLEDNENTTSLRIAYTSIYMLSFIIISIYAAVLMSHLTVFKPKLAFNSLQEFINDKSYKITVVKYSSYMERLYDEGNVLSKKLKTRLLNDNELKYTTGGAIEQVCRGMKVVFLMDDWSVRVNTPPDCELIAFDQEYLVNMGFAFVKNSPYVGLFNYYLQRFTDFGILHILKNRYISIIKSYNLNYESVTLSSVTPLFFVLTFGVLLSLLILIYEKIYFRFTVHKYEFAKTKTNYWKPLIREMK